MQSPRIFARVDPTGHRDEVVNHPQVAERGGEGVQVPFRIGTWSVAR